MSDGFVVRYCTTVPFVSDGSIGLKIKGILRIEKERKIQLKAERKWQSSSESFRLQL
jgi:hypothetical protein